MMLKEEILKEFDLFSPKTGGIGSWLTNDTNERVFKRLGEVEKAPLSKVQLNQLLTLGHEAPVSDGFFKYYWLSTPEHPYEVNNIPGFDQAWLNTSEIISLAHLKWGFYRLFIDGLLWFGNVRAAFRYLRSMSHDELISFFQNRKSNTDLIKHRGPALPLEQITKDDRYLISEMACKSYGDLESPGQLREALLHSYRIHKKKGGKGTSIRHLLQGDTISDSYAEYQQLFLFSLDEVLEEQVNSEKQLELKIEKISNKFFAAREAALNNTEYYLSMVNDLDVYVATSMRTRQDFRNMATACENIFSDTRLQELQLRYFDPTLSAARGHEDKGLIECLMVKCAKVLVYCAGDKESYGKDAEAAMALSLGKPVIFYCDQERRSKFYKNVHPLSRLIEFKTGVAVGALVTDSLSEVSELLYRIFENKMEYRLEHHRPGYLRLKDKLTDSVVRLQTNDVLLTQTFWNHYHSNNIQ